MSTYVDSNYINYNNYSYCYGYCRNSRSGRNNLNFAAEWSWREYISELGRGKWIDGSKFFSPDIVLLHFQCVWVRVMLKNEAVPNQVFSRLIKNPTVLVCTKLLLLWHDNNHDIRATIVSKDFSQGHDFACHFWLLVSSFQGNTVH